MLTTALHIYGIVIHTLVESNICPYDGDVEFHYSHHLYAASFCYHSYEYCSPRMFEDYYYFFRRVLDVDNPNCSKFIAYF